MHLLKRFRFSVPLLLLILFNIIQEGSSTFILSSLLAMTGGLMMGKMTLGGLMMMLMAANQQRSGQAGLRNLGTVPDTSGISVPTGDESAANPGSNLVADINDLIVRRKRSTKPNDAKSSTNSSISLVPVIDADFQYRMMRQVANSDPLSCLPQALCGISAIPPSKQSGFLNDYAYLLKTVLNRDEDIDDLDQDDEAIDDEKFEGLKISPKKKKTQQQVYTKADNTKTWGKGGTSPSNKRVTYKIKNKQKNPDESSEEDDSPVSKKEMEKLMMKEAFDIEGLANEELLEEDGTFMPYALRKPGGMNKLGPYEAPPQRPGDMGPPDEPNEYLGLAPSDLNKMSDAELDEMLAKLGGPGGHGPGGHGPGAHGPPDGPPSRYRRPSLGTPDTETESTGSFLSKLMPKLSLGFSPGKGGSFGDDSFFSGFKRSMDMNAEGFVDGKVRQPTEEEQKMFKEMIVRRRQRMDYILTKKKELSEIKDPVEKFRIAADFGERVKSPRQCRILFNNCPFNYTQVLEMIAGLRKVVLGQPLHPEKEKEKDTVVTLIPATIPTTTTTTTTTTQPPPRQQPQSFMNSGNGGIGMGITTIQTQLPTGEKMEISLQMGGSGIASKPMKRRTNTNTRPKRPVATAKPKRRKPALDVQDLFDEDDGHEVPAPAQIIKQTKEKPKPRLKPLSSLGSLESLKATMLAIEKINNVTVERRKQGKPVSYNNVLADLNLETKVPAVIYSTTHHPHPVTRRPTPTLTTSPTAPFYAFGTIRVPNVPLERRKPKPQITYKKNKKTSALATALAQLTSSTSLDDDEVDEQLPTKRPSALNIRRPPFPPQNTEIDVKLEDEPPLDSKKSKVKGQSQDEEEADEEGPDDDESSDEEDDKEDDYNNAPSGYDGYYRSGLPGLVGPDFPGPVPSESVKKQENPVNGMANVPNFQRRMGPFIRRHRSGRKPRKLYLGGSMEFRRTLPL